MMQRTTSYLSAYTLPAPSSLSAEQELRDRFGPLSELVIGVQRLFGIGETGAGGGRHLNVTFEARYPRTAEGGSRKDQVELRPTPHDIVTMWKGGPDPFAGLCLSDSAYPSYRFVRECTGISTLYAERSAFSDADGKELRDLGTLTTCYLDKSRITNLGFLTSHQLRRVSFGGTSVASIEPLRGHTGLELVCASGSKVSDLAPLAGKEALSTVMVDGAPIKDFTPLLSCEKLQKLFVSPDQMNTPGMKEVRAKFPGLDLTIVG